MIITHLLEEQFEGGGEVSGNTFTKVHEEEAFYIYEVSSPDVKKPHYELIRRIANAVCIDFANRVYSETEFRESYPKSKQFGVNAWTCGSLDRAMDKINLVRN